MLARCAARVPGTTTRRAVPLAAHHVGVGLPRRKSGMHAPARRSGVIVRAEADDFDSMLIAWADKWEVGAYLYSRTNTHVAASLVRDTPGRTVACWDLRHLLPAS